MTSIKVGDKVRRRPDAPDYGVDMSGVWIVNAVWPGPQGPVLRVRQGSRYSVVGGQWYITEAHARVIAAYAESCRRVGKERVARLARLWQAR